MSRQIQYVALTYRITKEGDQYSVICSELGTASCGDTIDEALKNIKDAVCVDLNTLERLGERSRFFKDRGIEMRAKPIKTGKWRPTVKFDEFVTRQNFQVPVNA